MSTNPNSFLATRFCEWWFKKVGPGIGFAQNPLILLLCCGGFFCHSVKAHFLTSKPKTFTFFENYVQKHTTFVTSVFTTALVPEIRSLQEGRRWHQVMLLEKKRLNFTFFWSNFFASVSKRKLMVTQKIWVLGGWPSCSGWSLSLRKINSVWNKNFFSKMSAFFYYWPFLHTTDILLRS